MKTPVSRAICALLCSFVLVTGVASSAFAQYCAGSDPTDAFFDISTSGALGLGNDDSIMCTYPSQIPPNLGFPLFGTLYDSMVISSNGYVMMHNYGFFNPGCSATPPAGGTDPNNVAMPGAAIPNAIIAPMWDDFDPSAAGEVRSVGAAGPWGANQRMIVQWNDVPHASGGGTVDFQVQMEEATGDIVFCYNDVDFGNAALDFGASATVGIEDGTGANALQVSFNSPALANNSCVHLFATCACNDSDGDGYGAPASPSCTFPQFDCDDTDPAVNPAATEVCDGIDNNCAFGVDETYDIDIDGWTTCAGDCDDTNPAVNPGQAEILFNGIDDDCDPATPANPACMSVAPMTEASSTVAPEAGRAPGTFLKGMLPLALVVFGLAWRRRRSA